MSDCPDPDTLATLSGALGWNAEERLAHVASCEECREQLRLLDSLHAVMAEEMPVPAALQAGILAALQAEAPVRERHWRVAALVLLLASLAAFALLVLTVQAGVSTDAPIALDVATAILLGLGATALAWREPALTRLA